MVSVYKVADRIVMLHDGRLIIDGPPEKVQKTDDPVVRQFIEGRAGDRIGSLSHSGSRT
jgi:phospholipid/cholesterol/gamma-HCH transport system ATP-binding protein